MKGTSAPRRPPRRERNSHARARCRAQRCVIEERGSVSSIVYTRVHLDSQVVLRHTIEKSRRGYTTRGSSLSDARPNQAPGSRSGREHEHHALPVGQPVLDQRKLRALADLRGIPGRLLEPCCSRWAARKDEFTTVGVLSRHAVPCPRLGLPTSTKPTWLRFVRVLDGDQVLQLVRWE